jgi:hypothetical protein
MRCLPKHLRRSRLGRLRPGGKPGCHHDELVVEKKFHIQIIRARLVGEGPRQSNYREIKGSLAQRRQVQRISAASRSAWRRCCSQSISWSTPWHPPRSRPVRAPCLPRSRQSRPLHSCCRGTDLGGAFERCDHLCCGRYLCNRAEICLNGGGAKGAGHRHWLGSTGNGWNPMINGRRQPSLRWHEPDESRGSRPDL